MGEKAIVSTLIGFILFVVCGLISLMDYIVYLLQASFIGLLVVTGMVFGIIFFVLGMVGLYGDN